MTQRVRSLLDMRKTGPDGKDHTATVYVFGNAIGEQVGSIKTAWKAACGWPGIKALHLTICGEKRRQRCSKGMCPRAPCNRLLGTPMSVRLRRISRRTRKGLHVTMRRFEALRDAREQERDPHVQRDGKIR